MMRIEGAHSDRDIVAQYDLDILGFVFSLLAIPNSDSLVLYSDTFDIYDMQLCYDVNLLSI